MAGRLDRGRRIGERRRFSGGDLDELSDRDRDQVERVVGRMSRLGGTLVEIGGLPEEVFFFVHRDCRGTDAGETGGKGFEKETSLRTRIVELGVSEGYLARSYRCRVHGVQSDWRYDGE